MSQNMPRVTRNDVDRFVSVHLEVNSPFSAWDVTKEMRDEYWAPHYEVREFVHEIMQPIVDSNAGWVRTNVTLDTGATFQVYYNSPEDLDEYIKIANLEQEDVVEEKVATTSTKPCTTDCAHTNVSRNPFRRLLNTIGSLVDPIFR